HYFFFFGRSRRATSAPVNVYAMPLFVVSHGSRIGSRSAAGTSFHVSAVHPTAGFGSSHSSGAFLPFTIFQVDSRILPSISFFTSICASGESWPLQTVHSISSSRLPPLPLCRTIAATTC